MKKFLIRISFPIMFCLLSTLVIPFAANAQQFGKFIERVGANNQTGTVGEQISIGVIVTETTVTTTMPVSGQRVSFQVTQGGGSLSHTSRTTNFVGTAGTKLTLGPNPGTNKVKASITYEVLGTPTTKFVIFTATGEALSTVNILDANLRAAIEEELDKESGDTITADEMASEDFTFLNANDSSISDLTGLEYATSLEFLYLSNNNISDISSLSELTNLIVLNLDDNSITDISDLSDIEEINTLSLENNSISDLSGLPNLSGVTILYLRKNQITDISPLLDSNRQFDSGSVYLEGNPLSDTSINTHIPALKANGVTVHFPNRKLRIVSGNNQTGLVSTTLPFPLVVEVLDLSDNPAPGVALGFQVLEGSASIDGGRWVGGLNRIDVTTGTDGRASLTINLGSSAGDTSITGVIKNSSANGVLFTVTATTTPPPTPTDLEIISGNGQTAETDQPLDDPFVVTVKDQDDNTMSNIPVSFSITTKPTGSTGASLDNTSVNTNANGRASTTLTLGNTAGTYKVTASVGALLTKEFTATATEPPPPPPPPPPTKRPTTLQKISGDGQSGETGTWLTDSFVVKVLDQNGDALPGVSVQFSVSPNNGSLSRTSHATDNNGQASTRLRFGSTSGTYTVTVSVLTVSPILK